MNNSIEIYRSQDGSVQLNVKLENETVWLTQSQMAELFGVDRTSIVRHIRNIYKSEELEEFSTCAKNAQVRIEGERQIVREIPYYNQIKLDRYNELKDVVRLMARAIGMQEKVTSAAPPKTIFAFLTLNTPRSARNKIFGAKFLSFEHLETTCLNTACYAVF